MSINQAAQDRIARQKAILDGPEPQWTPEQLDHGRRIQSRFDQAAEQARERLKLKRDAQQPSASPAPTSVTPPGTKSGN